MSDASATGRGDADRGNPRGTRSRRGVGDRPGSKRAFPAWSDEPLPKGAKVLVVEIRGARTVVVEPWETSPDLS